MIVRIANIWRSILGCPTIKRILFQGMGIFQSWKSLRAFIVRKESCTWSIGECHVKSEIANYVSFVRRMTLALCHFQLEDHFPTIASFQTSITPLGMKLPLMAVTPTTSNRDRRLCQLGEHTIWYNFLTLVNNLDWSSLVVLLILTSFSFPKTSRVC